MLAPVIVAFFRGRMWCGNFCPRGSFIDNIISKISFNKPVPKFIKTKWFRNSFLVLLMSSFVIQIAFVWGNLMAMGKVFVTMILITTLLTVILGVIYNKRTWCSICPMGNLSHYVAKVDRFKAKSKHVTFDSNKCVDCKLCSKSCPMDIEVLKYKKIGKVEDSDCLKCNICVSKCPKKSLYIA
jgi:polyferredoxin